MVQESASSQPPPSANPLIAQIDGLPIVSSKWKTLCPYSIVPICDPLREATSQCIVSDAAACCRNLKPHGSRLLRIRVIVKSASRLPPMPSREHHALQ